MIITNLVAVLVREAVECMDLRLLGPGPAPCWSCVCRDGTGRGGPHRAHTSPQTPLDSDTADTVCGAVRVY